MNDNVMKEILKQAKRLVMAAVAIMLLAALPAKAQLYGVGGPYTITNVTGTATNAFANYTNYNLGSNYLFDCTRYNNYDFSVALQATVTNAGSVSFYFRQSLDGTTNTEEQTNSFVITLPLPTNTTNAMIADSNFTVDACGYLFLDHIGVSYTNLIVGMPLGTNTASTNIFPTVIQAVKPSRGLY